jgi:PAS domain S-box-containing protein
MINFANLDLLAEVLDAHAIVSIADSAGNIIYVNDQFIEISGYPISELLGKNHRLLKSGIHPPEFYQEMWDVLLDGKAWHGEVCNRRKNGTFYWVRATVKPILDSNGLPIQYISIRTDITQLKLAEAELQRKAELQSIIAEISKGLLETHNINNSLVIQHALQRCGEYLNVDRAYLFLFAEYSANMSNTHEWCASGIEPQIHMLQNLPLADLPWWWRQMCAGGLLDVSDVSALPPEAYVEKAYFQSLQISSLIAMPLQENGKTYGFVGFDSVRTQRNWSDRDIRLMMVLTNLINSTLVRNRAEQAIEVHKERLRRGQSFANIGTWDWNIRTGDLVWTERIAPLFGYAVGELETSYDNFISAIHPDDRQMVMDAVNACVERDIPYEIKHRVVWPDGTVRWLLERGDVVRDESGNPLQMLGVVQDITDIISTQQQLEVFKRMVESVIDGVITIDHKGIIRSFNASASNMFGYQVQDVVGRNVNILMPEPYRAEHDGYLKRYFDHKSSRIMGRQLELTGCRSDGSVFPLEISITELDGSDDAVILGITRDITNRKREEQALVNAREEAERANQAKSDFLSSMSHELRTPMNAILGFAQMLEYDAGLSDDQQDNVHEILKGGRHLLELINEVLDLSKIEAGHVDLSLEPIELICVANECSSLIEPLMAQKQITLHLDISPGIAVRADRVRFKQALLNLLSNAVKYNRDGGHIYLDVQPAVGQNLRITVNDTGVGIAPDRIDELFQPFQRLGAEYSEVEGTGIGLTITRHLVELMGGVVGVDSQVGVGTTFWIDLPSEVIPDAEVNAKGEGVGSVQHTEEVHHTVLCIDDNPANLKLINQMLGLRQHIHVITAHTPELGIGLALTHQPDLILLDINMPHMDGYQVLSFLKADASMKDIPVIAVTANAMSRDIERGRAAGFSEYLTKPLNLAVFLKTIDSSLAGKKES